MTELAAIIVGAAKPPILPKPRLLLWGSTWLNLLGALVIGVSGAVALSRLLPDSSFTALITTPVIVVTTISWKHSREKLGYPRPMADLGKGATILVSVALFAAGLIVMTAITSIAVMFWIVGMMAL
jgi:hypothetical protein